MLNAREAARKAKEYVAELFDDEKITDLGLEGVEHNENDDTWEVVVGFSRPWNTVRGALVAIYGGPTVLRTYKLVKLRDTDGEVLSVKPREVEVLSVKPREVND